MRGVLKTVPQQKKGKTCQNSDAIKFDIIMHFFANISIFSAFNKKCYARVNRLSFM